VEVLLGDVQTTERKACMLELHFETLNRRERRVPRRKPTDNSQKKYAGPFDSNNDKRFSSVNLSVSLWVKDLFEKHSGMLTSSSRL
jgi:hypothetical protein